MIPLKSNYFNKIPKKTQRNAMTEINQKKLINNFKNKMLIQIS